MRLLPLGTTGYHANELRHTACYLLPEVGVVFDAGTGMFRLGEHLATDEVDIFLSHAHLDHVVGLTFLLETVYFRPMRRVTIHGEEHKLQAIREHLFHRDLFPVELDAEWRPLPDDVAASDGGVLLPDGGRLSHFAVEHPGGAVGFRIDWPARSLAYVTDTSARVEAAYVERIRGVDLLLHECNFGDDTDAAFAATTGHSRTSDVAEVAKAAGVGRLILTHLAPHRSIVDPVGLDVARRIFPNTELAEDLKPIEF